MLAQHIRLKDPSRVVIKLEHHAIEDQHVLGGGICGAGDGSTLDWFHVGRQALSACR